ncbi:MAG: cysteine--tRNA ligase [Candidatus Levybacteria bacterium]|nr:cysteine--tRNA ligase [Candidatus Levybacteria bacterium]
MRLYNTLSKKIEEFVPIHSPEVGMYTCGPTVYDFAHIGNFRTYTTADILFRVLLHNGYDVKYIMNITDVGHLTGDNLGDADTGEDRMEKSAKKEGKSAWDVAEFYTQTFIKDFERLNLKKPLLFAKATDHIKEQIDLIERLEQKAFTYRTSDGIYFDTAKFPEYGKLSNLDQIKEGARVEPNPEKKSPKDFALWKFSPKGETRQMEWESPWGIGFPGWHIECSAMSMKYLGESFDIHVGGIDLASTHHPNETAQSEAATGKQFVAYWVHGAFILIDGKRMSKSLGNNYTVQDIVDRGHDLLALRYLYLQTHYRQEMNFTWEALQSAQQALYRLYKDVATFEEPKVGCAEYEKRFEDALSDDLNTPQALSIMWEMLKSDYPTSAKARTIYKMDAILGLDLQNSRTKIKEEIVVIPDDIKILMEERNALRKEKRYEEADKVREQIEAKGYEVVDQNDTTILLKAS